MKIDAVITWVDGDDPKHRLKRMQYGSSGIFDVENIAGESRYKNLGEIFWCVASINRFAPFINKIYIVTDQQNPNLDEFLAKNFPDGHIPVEIVDHKVIFDGYESCLPTFNSISIETMTWRIPGLSEHFIEFNDDMMLAAPVSEEDFFCDDGKIVCYAEKVSLPWVWLTRKLKLKKNGIPAPVTFKGTMMNAALLAGKRFRMLKIDHTPRALRRSFYERYYSSHPEALHHNISHRFRDACQYNPQVLQMILLGDEGKSVYRSVKDNLFYIYPKNKKGYMNRKLKELRLSGCAFVCFNSIDHASDDELSEILDFVSSRLDIKF